MKKQMPEKSQRVLVITIDPCEASFRLRLLILSKLLAADGLSFDFQERPAGFFARRTLIATAGDYRAVIVQRKLLDPSHARLLRRRAKKILYDIDDAVMVQRRKISRWSQWLKNRRYHATAAVVDHVVAGNEYLAGQMRDLGCNVTVLPTVVNPDDYQVKRHAPTESPSLVWIGSKSTLPYLQQWMPAIEAAAKQVPGLRLITIANDTVRSDEIPVRHIPWSEHTEAQGLLEGDIGIAPTPIDRWSIGKSGFKIIQYMAAGLPTIASPVGANGQIVVDGITGLLPESMQQWTAAIVKLAGDQKIRIAMGSAARSEVMKNYTLERAASVWKDLLLGRVPTLLVEPIGENVLDSLDPRA
jgi:glycosyltransferase involved in cell wall biosynthesis